MLLNNIYRGHVPGIATWIIALSMLLAGGADAATDIDTCQDIIQEGEYRLNQSLTNDSTCVNIQSGNVTLDGAGFAISGTERPGTYGVLVFNSTMILTNITVKNLTTKYWESGIVFNNVVYGNITNTTASSNLLFGIYLVSSGDNTLTDNIANSNGDYGIYFDSSGGSALNNNTADLNKVYGFYFYSSDNNTLSNNNASSNDNTGFYLRYSNNNTLANSTASSNGENGIYLEYSSVRSNLEYSCNLDDHRIV